QFADAEAADGNPLLRITGRNLMRNNPPRVSIGGQPVSVLRASDREVLVAPGPHQFSGTLALATGPERATEMAFDLSPALAEAPSTQATHDESIREGGES